MFKKPEKHITDTEVQRSLPHNRKEVFFDLIKHRKMTLFALSTFTFMFFIPLAVDLFYFNFLESVAIANDKTDYLFSLVFYSMLIMIPCMVIGFIGLSGTFYVSKKIVWQEGIVLATDFFKGVRENIIRAMINGLMFAVVLFGLVVGGSYLLIFSPIEPITSGIGIGALILVFLLFGMITVIDFVQDVYYVNKMLMTFKNSFLLLALMNWKILVVFLLTTGGIVTLAAFNTITLGIGLFLFAILNSVVIVIYTLISHSAFDKYININHHPEMVGKGLYRQEEKKEEA